MYVFWEEWSFRGKFLHHQLVHSKVTMVNLCLLSGRGKSTDHLSWGVFWDKKIIFTNIPLELSYLNLPNYKYILAVLPEKRIKCVLVNT